MGTPLWQLGTLFRVLGTPVALGDNLWGPLWHLGTLCGSLGWLETLFGDSCDIWGHPLGTPHVGRGNDDHGVPLGRTFLSPRVTAVPLQTHSGTQPGSHCAWTPVSAPHPLHVTTVTVSPHCHCFLCIPMVSPLPPCPVPMSPWCHCCPLAPSPSPHGVTAAPLPCPHVPMVSLLPPCPVPMSPPRCPRCPPIPAVPTEGRSLKDEDVLQSLPVGTTATFYFRDLGAQISWVTVSGRLSPSVPLSFRLSLSISCPCTPLSVPCPPSIPRSSVSQCGFLSVCPSHVLPFVLSISVAFCSSVHPFVHPSVHLCLSVRPMSLPSVHPMFPCPFVCPFVHLCIHLMSPHHPTFFWPSLWSSVPLSIPSSILLSVPRPSVFLSIDVISCLCPFLRSPHVSLFLCPSHVLLSVSVLPSTALCIPRPSIPLCPSVHPTSLCLSLPPPPSVHPQLPLPPVPLSLPTSVPMSPPPPHPHPVCLSVLRCS